MAISAVLLLITLAELKTSPLKLVYLLALAIFFSHGLAYSQCGPTTTLFNDNNGQDGIMFDISAINCVTITQFECHMDHGTYDMEIYYKAGTHQGFTQNQGAWTLLGIATNVVGNANGQPTLIPINLSVVIQQGQVGAFYITSVDNPSISYTDGLGGVGDVYLSDGNLEILDGTGKSYPFNLDFQPRTPNIIVHYDCAGCCTPPIMSQADASCSGATDGTAVADGQDVSPWSYVWADSTGTVIQTANNVNGPNTITGLSAGTYTVSVTDGTGCQSIETVTISEPPPVSATASSTDPTCNGGGDGTATAVGEAPGPWSYVWEDDNGTQVDVANNINGSYSASGLAAGNYLVTVTNAAGCNAAAAVTLADPAPLSVTLTTEDVSCNAGDDGTATATGEGVSPWIYQWYDSNGSLVELGNGVGGPHTATGLLAGDYTVDVTDADGCAASGQVTVSEPTALSADQSQVDNLCTGDSNGEATVSNISGGVSGYTVSWSDINSQMGNTATGLPAAAYTATVMDANGCELELDFLIDQPDPIIIQTQPATDTCSKSVGSIGLTVEGGTPSYDFLWSNGDSVMVADGLSQGSYSVMITDANGCTASAQAVIGNIIGPKASYTHIIDNENFFEPTVIFSNTSTNATDYVWDFDDGYESAEEHPEHQYIQDGVYGVMLVAYNEYNCYDTVYNIVRIEPHFTFYIPNAFTPGNDELNNEFGPKGQGFDIDSYQMVIYDRWGDIIFQTNDLDEGWSGLSHDSDQWAPNGVYTYKITIREPIGFEPKYYYGHVTLIRD